MEYRIGRYKNCQRFNEQYESIYQFLLEAEKLEYNEHFHWGRFEWMHAHSYLDEDKLTSIAMFKDENGTIVGLTTYDTGYDDRVYLIHTSSDKMLLEYMVDTILEAEGDGAVIKANSNDTVLCQILQEKGFEKKLYKKLNVKQWKAKVPAWSPESFDMKHHTLDEIIQSMCNAEIVHEIIIVLSFVPILFSLKYGVALVFVCTSIIAALTDSMFVMIQRYNRPRIVKQINKKDYKH